MTTEEDQPVSEERVPTTAETAHDNLSSLSLMSDAESESDEPANQSPWSDVIPEELFLYILHIGVKQHGTVSFLCRVARVCRRWCDLAYHPSLWQSVDLSVGWITRDTRGLQVLCETRLQSTTVINLTSWFAFNDQHLQCVLENCPSLQSLNLSHCVELTPQGLGRLSATTVPLTELTLAFMSPAVSSHSCLKQLVASLGPQLVKLDLSHNMIDNQFCDVITAISETCHRLTHLCLSHLIDTLFTVPAVYVDMESLQQGCPQLQTLLLAHSKVKLRPAPEGVKAFSPGFPQLQKFTAPVCVTDDFLERTLKSSFELETLKLSIDLASDVNYTRVPAIGLRTLVVHKARPSQLHIKWHATLHTLDVSWMKLAGTWRTSSVIEREMARLFDVTGPRFEALRSLRLCGAPVTVRCIPPVFECCPRLWTLNLCMCGLLPEGWAKEFSGTELTFFKHVMVGIALPEGQMGGSQSLYGMGISRPDNGS